MTKLLVCKDAVCIAVYTLEDICRPLVNKTTKQDAWVMGLKSVVLQNMQPQWRWKTCPQCETFIQGTEERRKERGVCNKNKTMGRRKVLNCSV